MLGVAFLVLVAVYRLVSLSGPERTVDLQPGDAPFALPLSGDERLAYSTEDAKIGGGSLQVVLPGARGRHGVYLPSRVDGPRTLTASVWFRGAEDKTYIASMTQQDGLARATGEAWRASGGWELRRLTVALPPTDTILYFIVQRFPRSGSERFSVDYFRTVPWRFAFADKPEATPLAGGERLSRVRRQRRVGTTALAVDLPAQRGTQGIYFTQVDFLGDATFRTSLWFKGRRGKRYVLNLTQQDGVIRAAGVPWVATGSWERLSLVGSLRPGDTAMNIVLQRLRRGGAERFLVDGVVVEAWRFQSADAPAVKRLTGSERLRPTAEDAKVGRRSLEVTLPAGKGGTGVFVTQEEVVAGTRLVSSVWAKARRGERYTLQLTNQNGVVRGRPLRWTATGAWERRTLVASMGRRDSAANLVVQRFRAGARETLRLDDFLIERANGAAPAIG